MTFFKYRRTEVISTTRATYMMAPFEIDKHQRKTGDYSISNIQRNDGNREREREGGQGREGGKEKEEALIFAKVYRHVRSKNFIHNEITRAHKVYISNNAIIYQNFLIFAIKIKFFLTIYLSLRSRIDFYNIHSLKHLYLESCLEGRDLDNNDINKSANRNKISKYILLISLAIWKYVF